jgi:hypothetical protein
MDNRQPSSKALENVSQDPPVCSGELPAAASVLGDCVAPARAAAAAASFARFASFLILSRIKFRFCLLVKWAAGHCSMLRCVHGKAVLGVGTKERALNNAA